MRVVLVDGGSGAGKTTFAHALAQRWQQLDGRTVQLVSLDDCYPGWHGLAAGSRMLEEHILSLDAPGYRRWDWVAERPGDWVALDPSLPLLVEGCGAITRRSAPLADLAIWLELDDATRKHRALARDGDGYAPWWEVWAAQERRHWETDRPSDLAHLVVPATDLRPTS